jgi:phage/plasmid primase-like uncharacterized protein
MSNVDSVMTQLQTAGLVVEWPLAIGRLTRCKVTGDKGGKKSGWYVVHEFRMSGGDVVLVGRFGNYKLHGPEGSERIEINAQFSEEERRRYAEQMAAAARESDEERKRVAEEAARRAERSWGGLPDGGVSEYLKRKKVRAYGVKFARGVVVVPLRNIEGKLVGLQYIGADGGKKFITGTAKSGAFHVIGQIQGWDGAVAFAEGYATAATIHMALGLPVVVCFDCANLVRVVALWRDRISNEFLICGDDDAATPGNPGRTEAEKAARQSNGLACFPDFKEGCKGTDWNDLHAGMGLAEVKAQLFDCQRRALPVLQGDDRELHAQLAQEIDSSPSHLDGAQFADGGEFFPEDDQPQSGSGKPFARYQLADLLQHMSLIYGTDALWDNLNRVQMRLSALRHVVGRDLFKDWERSPFRRVVKGLVFEPSGVVPADYINTFDCLPLTPAHAPGGEGCEKIRAHIWNLAGRREEEFFWLLKWIAYPLQNPGAKMDTSAIMYGSEGPGKSVLWEKIVGPIYGQYAITIGQSQLESQFTGWQAGKLLAICEEVVSRTERAQHKGQLKHLVTGRTLMINEKNLPLREETNHLNFVFLSNSTIPLELDLGDRRYMVLFCNMEQPAGYFDELFQEIGSGGIEAFYGYLMSLDLSGFGPHTKPPLNREKEGLMEVSLPSPVLFLKEWQGGHLDLPYVSCPKSLLFEQYRRWCERTNEFKKRDRDFTAELRRYLKEDRRDLRIPSADSPHKTTRIWVTPDDAALEGTDDYISRLEWSCRKFILECEKQVGSRYGQEAA